MNRADATPRATAETIEPDSQLAKLSNHENHPSAAKLYPF